jgi:hypothetical protein
MQLGKPQQIPEQLIRLARRDLRGVHAGERLREQRQPRIALRLLDDAQREIEEALLAGREVQFERRIQQHRRGQSVMVAQIGNVDAAARQRAQTQIADLARCFEV